MELKQRGYEDALFVQLYIQGPYGTGMVHGWRTVYVRFALRREISRFHDIVMMPFWNRSSLFNTALVYWNRLIGQQRGNKYWRTFD